MLLVPDTQTEGGTGPGEETDQLKTTRIQAVVKAVEDGKILVESQTEEPYPGEILLSTSVFDTRFVDGETGFQAEPSDLHAGDTIYADIRTVMAEMPAASGNRRNYHLQHARKRQCTGVSSDRIHGMARRMEAGVWSPPQALSIRSPGTAL